MTRDRPSVLAISGLDPSGGAGLLADASVISLLRCQPMGLATCLTVQNLSTFHAVNPVPVEVLEAQLDAVLAEREPDAVKIGLVPTTALAVMLARRLSPLALRIPVVLDPVLTPSLGAQRPSDELVQAFRRELLPACTALTPNVPELLALAGAGDVVVAARALLGGRLSAVLVKGGHSGSGPLVEDVLVRATAELWFRAAWLPGPKVHGTGCVLASALAALLALGRSVEAAARDAFALLARLRTQAEPPPAPGAMARLRIFPD